MKIAKKWDSDPLRFSLAPTRFLLLPNDIFTIRSAEKYEKFIEAYGTHVIVGSSFGGSFIMQMISSSSSYNSFDDFRESSQMEMDSIKGLSVDKSLQLNAAINTISGDSQSQRRKTAKGRQDSSSWSHET